VALTLEEQKDLTFMREEEKLAQDVYTFLASKWNLRIFSNIARSEQTHFLKDALEVGGPIEKADIADLEAAIARTRAPDVRRVYVNLMNASHNHLDAFETVLEVVEGVAR